MNRKDSYIPLKGKPILYKFFRECQAGFRKDRTGIVQSFTLRQLFETG